MKTKAFTLLEVLLSVIILLGFLLAMACFISVIDHLNPDKTLSSKITDYVTLTKFARATASSQGTTTKILVETNKLKVVEVDRLGNTNPIESLNFQLEWLNDSAMFEGMSITFFPDGTVEDEVPMKISVENETNTAFVKINEWNRVTIKPTNDVVVHEEDFELSE